MSILLTILLTLGLPATAEMDENQKAEQPFERIFQEELARSPVFQTELGMKTSYDKWDDLSEEFEKESHALDKKYLTRLKELRYRKLNEA